MFFWDKFCVLRDELNALNYLFVIKMTKWTETPIVDLSSHIKSFKTTTKVLNPIFESISKLVDDPLWVEVFVGCSRGKFPKGFAFQNNFLKHRRGPKLVQVYIPDNPDEALPI